MESSAVTPTIESLLAERAWLRRLAGALVRDDDLAEDLTQDVYTAALQQPLDGIRSPRRWLGSLMRHRAQNVIRGERRRRKRDRRHGHRDAARSVDEIVARAELAEQVGREVLALREPYRSAVLLRFYEEEPPRRIAARLQIPVETVRTRVRRGLALLREKFDEQEKRSGGDWRLALLPLLRSSDTAPAHAVGATTMTNTPVVVALFVVVIGGAALWWAPWSGSDSADQRRPRTSDLRAGHPADASHAEASSPHLRGGRGDAESSSRPEDDGEAADAAEPARDDSPTAAAVESEGGASEDPEDPAPSPEAACVIRVLDDRGEPIEGVRITFYRDPARPVNAPTAVTGEDGRASFDTSDGPEQMYVAKVPPSGRGGAMSVWQTHEFRIEPDVVRSKGVREIVLRRLEPIVGQVLAPDGTPLAKAWVSENAQDSRLPGFQTDAEGRFRFPAPAGTAVDLLVLDAHPRASPPGGRLRGTATKVQPGTQGLVIQLAEAGEGHRTLTVRVLDPEERPLANVRVGVRMQDGSNQRKHATTNAEGIAEFEDLPANRVTVTVLSDSAPWMAAGQRDLVYEHIPDVEPKNQEVVVRVRRGERLTIRVVTKAGMGVRGVRVRLLRDGKPLVLYGGPMPLLPTGDGGNCVLLLPPDLDGPLAVEAVYSEDKHTTVQDISPRQGLVTVRLDP